MFGKQEGQRGEILKVEVLEKDLPEYRLRLTADSPATVEEALREVLENLQQVMIGIRLIAAYTGKAVLEQEL